VTIIFSRRALLRGVGWLTTFPVVLCDLKHVTEYLSPVTRFKFAEKLRLSSNHYGALKRELSKHHL